MLMPSLPHRSNSSLSGDCNQNYCGMCRTSVTDNAKLCVNAQRTCCPLGLRCRTETDVNVTWTYAFIHVATDMIYILIFKRFSVEPFCG
ncbi:hypothetical protein F2P81_024939 [Scophthalmus maximus]|uniref:Uncharacterized protein n=1 Tax=Scophthalmus maximus TaxID=52904 RepID=A0A6A4RSD9_SCOMX|nr:hypothetical protein F2P81_024939 [Scophthalmus maximus]